MEYAVSHYSESVQEGILRLPDSLAARNVVLTRRMAIVGPKDGATPEEILRQYPGLRAEHVPAALGYAAELARERLAPIPA